MAQDIAQRSLCERAKVGAIITGPDGLHIVGEGYNGPPAGYRHGAQPCNIWCKRATAPSLAPDYSDCVTLHAEANALMKSDYTARLGGTIYITSHPCWGCAKLIANSGLARVVVQSDASHVHRNPLASYNFLLECGLEVSLPGDAMMMSRLSPRVWASDAFSTPIAYPERLVD